MGSLVEHVVARRAIGNAVRPIGSGPSILQGITAQNLPLRRRDEKKEELSSLSLVAGKCPTRRTPSVWGSFSDRRGSAALGARCQTEEEGKIQTIKNETLPVGNGPLESKQMPPRVDDGAGGLPPRDGDGGGRLDQGKAKVAEEPSDGSSKMNQMFGIRGASAETNIWKIRLQLTKPVTWAPLIWGVACGAAASGNFNWGNPEDVAKAALCMFMSGPLLTGYTQTINDWYDKEIDAINEPYRPIPSGAISEPEVIAQILILLFGGLGTAYVLDLWAGHDFPSILCLALGGSFLSYIYSAPPLKLKQSGWIGNYALGSSYISLPWWSGQLLFGTLPLDIVVLTLLYSTAGLGIAIINDFKSIEGDRAMGLQSLPVAFGVDTAKWICAGTIDITQLSVAAYLLSQGKTTYGLILLALIAPQILFQFQYFLNDPIKNDVKYQGSAQPFFVFGLLVTALATSH